MAIETGPGGDEKGAKRVRGAFPRIALSRILEIPETVYLLGEGEAVRRRRVLDHLKRSADSSTSRVAVTGSTGGYGLTTGGKDAEFLALTDLGKKLVTTKDPVARREITYDVLFSNELFKGVAERFRDRGVPIDDVAIEFLKTSHGLRAEDAGVAWAVIRENLIDHALVEEDFSGKRVIIGREHAVEKLRKEVLRDNGRSPVEPKPVREVKDALPETDPPPPIRVAHGKPRSNQEVVPQIVFNIQVVIPDTASAETIDNIFKSIGMHLLGRGEVS